MEKLSSLLPSGLPPLLFPFQMTVSDTSSLDRSRSWEENSLSFTAAFWLLSGCIHPTAGMTSPTVLFMMQSAAVRR